MNIFVKKAKPWNEYLNFSGKTDISQVGERVKERLKFFGIDQDSLAYVKEAAIILAPFKEELINHFYENIQSVEQLQKIILQHSTFEKLKKTMEKYLHQFLSAEVNYEYISTRLNIGQVHSRINLTAEHFISAHHLMIQLMTSILMEKSHQNPDRMMKTVLAVQKLAAFDQQLIVEKYMEETFKSFLFSVSDMLSETTGIDTTKQLITSMEKQLDETYSVTAATEEMSSSIQEVANYATKVAEGTDEAVQSAEDSKRVVDEALHGIQMVGHVYEEVVTKVGQLSQEIKHTQDVVKMIREIADQTNLLALNASIEAARAGEHGRGFSVVAAEVRKLSEHTKEQIIKITSNMDSLQQVSVQLIQQIRDTGNLVEQSVTGAEYAGDALMRIVSMMKEISESTAQIAAMSEEQTATVVDIAERNSIINEYSVHSQKIAKQTAETVFELSSQLDDYRKSFFNINVKLSAKDIVRVAKTDHLLWKWKVYNMMLGVVSIGAQEVTSHDMCRLGKWYYGDLPAHVKSKDAFKQLEEPHKEVHQYAKLAVECYTKSDSAGVEKAFEQLERASNQVIELLTRLEAEL
ncbi:methyl-accepting chemotaxis protein [Robertmurraya andreesenii]|uniref:Methyl-accepting chemotaxis protein n=1 Tax=Anoxybacillus andreesenii TaxID=1325932 RepID=A0ABT9V395_9BACL|nr:methyl-accepting chemotaxis protein [Robertmurraya andreesenii]MDQ0155426.1 methyl-accepting chemotaxis protein [Robertmurraya andreesenii]